MSSVSRMQDPSQFRYAAQQGWLRLHVCQMLWLFLLIFLHVELLSSAHVAINCCKHMLT